MPARKRAASPTMVFEIWQAKGRITSIDNPVRMRLLRQLERGPATLNELVTATRKTKGTLSALHLPPLLSAGVVDEAIDPMDARVKWYKLAGHRLGSSAVDAKDLRDAVLGYVQTRGLIPLRPLLEILNLDRLLRSAKPDYVDAVAYSLGRLVGGMLLGRSRAERAAEISQLMEREGIGKVRWERGRLLVYPKNPDARTFLWKVAEAALEGTL